MLLAQSVYEYESGAERSDVALEIGSEEWKRLQAFRSVLVINLRDHLGEI